MENLVRILLETVQTASQMRTNTAKSLITIRYYNNMHITHEIQDMLAAREWGIPVYLREFAFGELSGAFTPFLHIIRENYEKYTKDELKQILQKCDFYHSHKQMFLEYFMTGHAVRREEVLLDEVEFERKQILEEIGRLLCYFSEKNPFVLVINRLNEAGNSTISMIQWLIHHRTEHNIRLVLMFDGMREVGALPQEQWNEFLKLLERLGQMVDYGRVNTQQITKERRSAFLDADHLPDTIRKIHNMISMLDLSQAEYYLSVITKMFEVEHYTIETEKKLHFWWLQIYVLIFSGSQSQALAVCEKAKCLLESRDSYYGEFFYYYYAALANMYSGFLIQAKHYGEEALKISRAGGDEFHVFQSKLLLVMLRMAGWHNLFFCPEDIEISDELLAQASKYGYATHLAYIEVYAYDNDAEAIKKSLNDESVLPHYYKGISWAKNVNNKVLLQKAYQKNILIASNAGMHRVSDYFYQKTYEIINDKSSPVLCTIYDGLAYNSSALGHVECAHQLLRKSLELERRYEHSGETVAETLYNMSLNAIRAGYFARAFQCICYVIQIIQTLRMNCLRFCNVAKIFSLAALCQLYMGNTFSAQRYLIKSESFLQDYLENEEGQKSSLMEKIIYDDLFTYYFAVGLYWWQKNNLLKARSLLEKAERFLQKKEKNQLFCIAEFRKIKASVYEELDEDELTTLEKQKIRQLEEDTRRLNNGIAKVELVKRAWKSRDDIFHISQELQDSIRNLIRMEGLERRAKEQERQMIFRSRELRMLEEMTSEDLDDLWLRPMQMLQNQYSIDRVCVLSWRKDRYTSVYHTADLGLTSVDIEKLADYFRREPRALVASKFGNDFQQYAEVIRVFGMSKVCSLAAIPFFQGEQLEHMVFCIIYMRDNWHSQSSHFDLDTYDLANFELIFQRVFLVQNRLEKEQELKKLSEALKESSVTDYLTGIGNRDGFFGFVRERMAGKPSVRMAIMFIDVDNFKPCNDKFGHEAGDVVLKKLAGIFSRVIEEGSFVGRYGGDEFIICVPNAESKQLEGMASQINEILKNKEYLIPVLRQFADGQEVHSVRDAITCSIGIAVRDIVSLRQIPELISEADNMMYQVKKTCKGCFMILDEERETR